MDQPTDHQLSIHIDLRGMTNRMQRLLRHAMNLVAIGLHAKDGISEQTLTIPDVTIHHQFDSSNQWSIDVAQASWETWILRNGFRDVSEALASVLEEVQSVLSCWKIVLLKKERGLSGEDWNEIVVRSGQQFHRRTLPQKLDFLEKRHDFKVDDGLVRQALSINAARNCLVHRSGVVQEADVHSSGQLTLEWSALCVATNINGQRKEIRPPQFIEAGTEIEISNQIRKREFSIGDFFQVSSEEFTEICWTLYVFTASCTQSLQNWAEARGFEFRSDDA